MLDLGLGTDALWSDLAFAGVVASAFAVQGTIGFGAMLVAVGVGGQLMPLERLVPIGLLLSIPPNLLLIARDHRHVDRRLLFGRVLPAMALGVPVGVWLLGAAPDAAVRIAYGAFVAALAVRELWRSRPGGSGAGAPLDTPRALGLLGVGGIVHGMFSTGGPMVVTVVGRLGLDKRVFRATLLALWLTLGVWTATGHAIAGRLDAETAVRSAKLLPALAIGTWLGDRLHDRVDPARSARWVQGLLVAAGLSLIIRALLG